ncbi:MAG TPA: RDD family protein, partial [Phycisphaerales bacterium]|nr:RDD family protein [Phycisphaerales bacterium]
YTLDRLDGNTWNAVELPSGVEPGGSWAVFGDRLGLSLVRTDGAAATILRLGPDGRWTESDVAVNEGAVAVGVLHGRVVFLEPEGESRAGIVLVEATGPARLGSFEIPHAAGEPGLAAVVIPDATGRLVLLWGEASAGGSIEHKIREVSLSTGRVLYDGPVVRVTPVSPREFQLMAVGMLLVMVVSLYVVLRPADDRTPPEIPEGSALAPPGRRFAATVLDVCISALPVSWVFGVPVANIITFGVVLDPGDSWLAVPAMFAVGLVYGTVMEALFGGTVGKLLLGCRVIPARGGGRRLGWRACFLRNLIKWVLPPVAGLAMLDPSGRHRGDLLAGAIVIISTDGAGTSGDGRGGPDAGPGGGPDGGPEEGGDTGGS